MKVEDLMEWSAKAAGVERSDMMAPNRNRDVIVAKEIFCHYAYEHLSMKHSAIAYKLKMDRSSVYHHLKRYNEDIGCRDLRLYLADLKMMTLILSSYKTWKGL